MIEGRISPQVSTAGNAFTLGSERYQIILISKNVGMGTAVVQLTISDTYIPPPPVESYTDTMKFYLKPWGWYSPNGAANEIAQKLIDIDGAVANYFSGITDYSYVRTDITTEGEYAVINVRLNSLQPMGMQSLALPLAAIGIILYNLFLVLIGIAILVGVIALYKWVNEPTKQEGPATTPPPVKVLPGVDDANNKAQTNCFTTLPTSPTCDQLAIYANCLDSVSIGINGTLEAVYPNSPDIVRLYDKYDGIYSKLTSDCNPNVPGQTPADIMAKIKVKQGEYKKDLKGAFEILQSQYKECNIAIGTFCADGLVMLGGLLLGGYIIYKIAK